MSAFTIYRQDTGVIVKVFTGPARQIPDNTPAGCAFVEGRYDGRSQRIDLTTLQPVDWQPPQPSPDYEWHGKRWVLSEAATRKRMALREIRRLERTEQPRAMREATLGLGTQRLQKIEDRIVELRTIITSKAQRPES